MSMAPFVTATSLQRQALYRIMQGAGIATGRVVQELSAESADPLCAQLLDTEIGSPLIRVSRLIHDADEVPMQYARLALSPEHSRILMDIPAHDIDTATTGFIAHDVQRPSG